MLVISHELTDFEWKTLLPLLPNKPRGVPRVDDRGVLNGICITLRSGVPCADLPEGSGPCVTAYNRFNHWRKRRLGRADGRYYRSPQRGRREAADDCSMSVRVHQQATAQRCNEDHCSGRSRGGLTTK